MKNTNSQSEPGAVSLRARGFTFVETIVVAAIILLLAGFFSVNLIDRIPEAKLDRDVAQFVHTLRGAVQEAILRQETLTVISDGNSI